MTAFRGAEAPLFHGGASLRSPGPLGGSALFQSEEG